MRLRRSFGVWLVVPLATFALALGGFMALGAAKPRVSIDPGTAQGRFAGALAAAATGTSAEFAGAGCTIVYTDASGDHSWHTAANWSPLRVPASDDVACVPGGKRVVIKHNVNVKRFVNHGDLTIAGGNVNFGSGTSG